jgi:hypothetical protein
VGGGGGGGGKVACAKQAVRHPPSSVIYCISHVRS